MAKTYTDKQITEIMATYRKTRAFPENTKFDPSAEARGEPIIRDLTADELKKATVADPVPSQDESE